MLEISTSPGLVEARWQKASLRTQLPEEDVDFFDARGATAMKFDSDRSYHRFHMRDKAVLIIGESAFAAYSKDISRTGVAILAPVQLFPEQRVELLMASGRRLKAVVRRCRRLNARCYECGARFIAEPEQK